MKRSDHRPAPSSEHFRDSVADVLAGIARDLTRHTLEPPPGELFEARHLRRLLAVLDGGRAGAAVTLRGAVEACLTSPGAPALARLADAVQATVSRPVRVDAGLPRRVILRAGRPGDGPWLGYLFGPGGGPCWLALGWRRLDQLATMLSALPADADERYRPGPIETGPGSSRPGASVLLSVEYRAGALPPLHAMVNDLHAMVILHDVLREDARRRPSRET